MLLYASLVWPGAAKTNFFHKLIAAKSLVYLWLTLVFQVRLSCFHYSLFAWLLGHKSLQVHSDLRFILLQTILLQSHVFSSTRHKVSNLFSNMIICFNSNSYRQGFVENCTFLLKSYCGDRYTTPSGHNQSAVFLIKLLTICFPHSNSIRKTFDLALQPRLNHQNQAQPNCPCSNFIDFSVVC